MIYREISNNVIVDRIVFDSIMPPNWAGREGHEYEPETEDPPPQIGWSRPGPGQAFVPPPDPLPAGPI